MSLLALGKILTWREYSVFKVALVSDKDSLYNDTLKQSIEAK